MPHEWSTWPAVSEQYKTYLAAEIKKRVEAEAQLAKLEGKIHRFRRNARKRKKRA